MSLSLSDILTLTPAENGMTWSACEGCPYRKSCPHLAAKLTESARFAARRERAAAHLLTAEADRLLQAVSRADNACRLLSADDAVEYTLARVLRAEMDLTEHLSGC